MDRPKVPVRVIQVQGRLSVAQTFRSRRKNVGGIGGLGLASFNKLFDPPEYVRVYDTFRSDQATWEDIDEAESFVKVGDKVRQSVRYTDA